MDLPIHIVVQYGVDLLEKAIAEVKASLEALKPNNSMLVNNPVIYSNLSEEWLLCEHLRIFGPSCFRQIMDNRNIPADKEKELLARLKRLENRGILHLDAGTRMRPGHQDARLWSVTSDENGGPVYKYMLVPRETISKGLEHVKDMGAQAATPQKRKEVLIRVLKLAKKPVTQKEAAQRMVKFLPDLRVDDERTVRAIREAFEELEAEGVITSGKKKLGQARCYLLKRTKKKTSKASSASAKKPTLIPGLPQREGKRAITEAQIAEGVLKILEHEHSAGSTTLSKILESSGSRVKKVLDAMVAAETIEHTEVTITTSGAELGGHPRKVKHYVLKKVGSPGNGHEIQPTMSGAIQPSPAVA